MTKIARSIAEDNSKEIAKKMLLRNYEDKEVAECTGLSLEEVEKLRVKLDETIENV